jgi:hypothetical protein
MLTPLEAIPKGSYIVIESSYFNPGGEEIMKKFIINLDEYQTELLSAAGDNRRRLPHQEAEIDCIDVDVFIENALIF